MPEAEVRHRGKVGDLAAAAMAVIAFAMIIVSNFVWRWGLVSQDSPGSDFGGVQNLKPKFLINSMETHRCDLEIRGLPRIGFLCAARFVKPECPRC
jgi:hypothetical protein